MILPLLPKATAMWLIKNTSLTFQQIGDFCGLHLLEVQNLADEEQSSIIEENPIISGQLTREEINRCEKDSSAKLKLKELKQLVANVSTKKQAKYTPIARRQDKPDAVMWLLKNYPDISDSQIIKLLGTTKSTISSVKHKEHWNMQNIRPRDPVLLGLCSQTALNAIIESITPKEKKES